MKRNIEDNESMLYGLAGGAVACVGLFSTSSIIKLVSFGGAAWLFYQAARHYEIEGANDNRKAGDRGANGGRSRDKVDQASWESFPASDPPGY